MLEYLTEEEFDQLIALLHKARRAYSDSAQFLIGTETRDQDIVLLETDDDEGPPQRWEIPDIQLRLCGPGRSAESVQPYSLMVDSCDGDGEGMIWTYGETSAEARALMEAQLKDQDVEPGVYPALVYHNAVWVEVEGKDWASEVKSFEFIQRGKLAYSVLGACSYVWEAPVAMGEEDS
jgi:hypothetical protein